MRLFSILVAVILLSVEANGRPYYFRHYSNDNGLSNNNVMACIQDRRGFIWLGTKEGLNRFDGFRFKVLLNNPSSSNCLINNFITSIYEDREGWIWIGTPEGICYYIPENDCFGTIKTENPNIRKIVYDIKSDNNNSIWIALPTGIFKYSKENNKLNYYPASEYFSPISISLTNAGDIWLSATDGNIYKYDVRADNFISFKILTEKEISASVRLGDIQDAGNYGLIISTNIGGLRQFDPNSGNFSVMFKKDNLLSSILIRTTYMFSQEEIWIGSESGIYIYNLETGYVTNLQTVRTDPFSLSNNAIRTITKDREGGIWICTFYGGVNYLPPQNKPFEKYYATGLPGALNANVIREIRADSYGNIWIGTEDAGLVKLDHQTGQISCLSEGLKLNIESRNIQGIMVDHDDLWIGTYDNGIYILDIPTERLLKHFVLTDAATGLSTNSFITFLRSKDGTIYAGSVIGIFQFNPGTSSFIYRDDLAGGTFIHCLFEDNEKNIWIGTYGRGLYKYDTSAGNCKKILSAKENYEYLTNEHVTSIYEDINHNIWFTTEGNGFFYIDGETEVVTRYIMGQDVNTTIYCAMLQDGFGNLWITSTRGLLRLDPVSNKYTTYTQDDGLLENNFSYNSAYQDKNGKMYFGTIRGMISFYPANIRENTFTSPVFITGMQVDGKEYMVNTTRSTDFSSILTTRRISLKYDQSSFSIDFVSPAYASPNLIKYKYMMEGSDHDWILISGNRKVYYTNLSPGEYRFRVLSSPDGKTWGPDEARLDIKISPPVWFSIPAYILYFIITAYIGYMFISFYLKKNALEHQRKVDIINSNKEKEILNAKINFFTSITHEVRTPLTLIKGPLDRILKSGIKNPQYTEDNLLIIKRNTTRLMSLTNQLLDFRKTDKEMFKLNFIKTDLYKLVESTYNLFLPYSEEKMISVQLHSPVNQYILAIDTEAITKILTNLLSNALKFAESKVDIYFEPETDQENLIRIRVNNDGNILPVEKSNKIFEPFYQLESDNPGEKGTGLGLSIAQSLAELHHGRLFFDANVKNYNSFVLELTKSQEETITRDAGEPDDLNHIDYHEFEIFGSTQNVIPIILLVEDELEMGRFIAEEISGDFNVILTSNGKEALKALKKYNIILVISDVKMPGIDGYELCRQIKSNIESSHIPVILLTAITHMNARIEGLDSGADAYIEKPFTTELLMAQILNLIKNRSLERQNYINFPLSNFKSVALNKTDEEFLTKLNSFLIENISENDLSVERIAEILGISVSTLYRKVKALTDLNSIEYIRLTRLKKAAELLSEGNYRINEISYLVGFTSPSYFATSFQKQFGISPSQFIRKLQRDVRK
jgi:signal transduction histidine kinase/ligand-binding sensor domain-containing protein/DNA-binding response OmpR family regulator